MAAYWSGSSDLTQVPPTARLGSQPGLVVVLAAWTVLLGVSVVQDVIGLDTEARAWLLDVGNEHRLGGLVLPAFGR